MSQVDETAFNRGEKILCGYNHTIRCIRMFKQRTITCVMPVTQGLRKNPIFCEMHAIKLE